MDLPKAILLDLDDTIVAYDAAIGPIWDEICSDYAGAYAPIKADLLKKTIREKSRWYWGDLERHRRGRRDMKGARREIVKLAFDALSLPTEDSIEVADEYSRQRREQLELFPGAQETLVKLKARAIKLALVSNGEAALQREKLEKFSLERYFDFIMLEGKHDFGKPDHRMFTIPLEEMKLTPRDAWMVGDSLTYDIAPAKELGIYSVWNDWKGKGLPATPAATPDRTITNISELLD